MTMTVGELKIGNIELGLIYPCVTPIDRQRTCLRHEKTGEDDFGVESHVVPTAHSLIKSTQAK